MDTIFASTVVGVVSLGQVVLITIMWQRLRDLDKKIDGAVAELRAEMRQLAAELRAEMRQGFDRTDGIVTGLAERFGQTEQRVSHLEGREKTPAAPSSQS